MKYNWIIDMIGHIGHTYILEPMLEASPNTQQYQEPGQSLFTTKDYVADTLANGGWQCCCGRANLPYVTTCTCGMNKRGQRSADMEQHLKKKQQTRSELEEKIRECNLLYESHFISSEEYEEEMRRLTRYL